MSTGKRIEQVNNYEELKDFLKNVKSTDRLFILFTGSKDENGKSWCPDCVAAEKPIETMINSSLFPTNGIFLYCYVGDKLQWKDNQCPFRIDSQLKLKNIPTLIEWKTGKCLVERDLLDQGMIEIIFEN